MKIVNVMKISQSHKSHVPNQETYLGRPCRFLGDSPVASHSAYSLRPGVKLQLLQNINKLPILTSTITRCHIEGPQPPSWTVIPLCALILRSAFSRGREAVVCFIYDLTLYLTT